MHPRGYFLIVEMLLLFLKSIILSIIYFTFSQAEKVKGNDRRASRSSLISHGHTLVRNLLYQIFFLVGEDPTTLQIMTWKLIVTYKCSVLALFSHLFFFIYILPQSFF